MTRQLTALKKRYIIGTRDAVSQVLAFAALGIPAILRNPTGHMIVECIAYTHNVRPRLTELE